MQELRWILLAAGIALIAGLYVLGVRARRRSAAPEITRTARVEAPLPAAAIDGSRIEPRVGSADDESPAIDLTEPGLEELPVLEIEGPPEPDRSTAPAAAPQRREPTLDGRPESSPTRQDRPPRSAPTPKSQKIIALRVTAPAPERFEGALVKEAVQAEGYTFGRFDIFHRLDASGRPILSLASLLEPGTFDPATMAGCSYPGVALFAVLPGPVPAPQALEELVESARYLADRLGGSLLDDRGAPLSMQRIGQLREEVLDFERGHSGAHGA
jgi:cell division protein ZipA